MADVAVAKPLDSTVELAGMKDSTYSADSTRKEAQIPDVSVKSVVGSP
jgi:hypothetical protein